MPSSSSRSLPENGAARHVLGELEARKAPAHGAVEQPVVDRPAEPAANAGEVVHIGAAASPHRAPGPVTWSSAIGERRGIALDAEQELAALVVVAELAADDGAVEVDGGQHGRRRRVIEDAVDVLPGVAAVEARVEPVPRIAHLRTGRRHGSGDSGDHDRRRKIILFQATYSLARFFFPSYAGDAT